MESLKSSIGIIIVAGLCSLTTTASAQSCIPAGTGTAFCSRYPVTELHSTSTNAASAFAACTMMGAQGFINATTPVDWESLITAGCTAQTRLLAAPPIGTGSSPLSVWPATCNPDGMALFLNQSSTLNPPDQPRGHWITSKFTDQPNALTELIRSLRDYGSPAVVPIFGQADHWVTVTQVTTNTTTGAITNVKALDGGMIGGADSSGNSYSFGPQSWSATVWKNVFFLVVTAINIDCDDTPNGGCGAPPVNDPFANKYLVMYDPPVAGSRAPFAPVIFATIPGMVSKGAMNENVAQLRVLDALMAGGINADAELWNGVKAGTPGTSFHVVGVWPSGAAWDYYLVPILSSTNTNTAIGFVQLAAEDGAFESVNLLTTRFHSPRCRWRKRNRSPVARSPKVRV